MSKSKKHYAKQHKERAASAPVASKPISALPRPIAFYLPQYHPIPENDAWWGKGFTEWTNVTRAEASFDGHHQPRRPADLGYYDLRVPQIMEEQARLAREHGIHGFCYYYYWFAGRRLLEQPLDRMLASGTPDFPFCLCWANENWSRRWDGSEQEVLMRQEYGPDYARRIIRDMLPFLLDRRYIQVDGKPLLLVYRVDIIPDCAEMTAIWREEAATAGLPGLYLVRVESFVELDPREYGFDAACEFPPHLLDKVALAREELTPNLNPGFEGAIFDYATIAQHYGHKPPAAYKRFKSLVPMWDNTARKKLKAYMLVRSSPALYRSWLAQCLRETVSKFAGDERLVFINAWNEWAEGCYLEPDEEFGHQYLQATREAMNEMSRELSARSNPAGLGKMDFAVALFDSGQYAEAYAIFSELLATQSDNPLILVYVGLIALRSDLPEDAHNFFAHAAQSSQDAANTLAAIGQRCMSHEKWDFAEHYLRQAIARQPRLIGANVLLADVLEAQGRQSEALSVLASVGPLPGQDGLAIALRQCKLAQELGELELEWQSRMYAKSMPDSHARAIELMSLMDNISAEQRGAQIADFCARFVGNTVSRLPAAPRQRLKIGFVLGMSHLNEALYRLAPLLQQLDAERFESLVFATDVALSDAVQGIFLLADAWVSLAGLDTPQIDEAIRSRRVDILINLNGFANLAALDPFARRNAPLQLMWNASERDTALPNIDATVHSPSEADAPPASRRSLHIGAPQAWRLPPYRSALAPRLPAQPRLACLQPVSHIANHSWELWARILQALPQAQLKLNSGLASASLQAQIEARFETYGVSAQRICWVQALDDGAVLDAWRDVQLGLCPLAGDSAHSALLAAWAGVPCVTADWGAAWSRHAAQSMRQLGVSDLIARDEAHYVELACSALQAIARSTPEALQTQAQALHQRVRSSPVNDAAGFAQAFGDALWAHWHTLPTQTEVLA